MCVILNHPGKHVLFRVTPEEDIAGQQATDTQWRA